MTLTLNQFCFSGREENAEKIIKEAMLEWEAKTCIRFVNRTNEEDFVKFEKLEGYVYKLSTTKICYNEGF